MFLHRIHLNLRCREARRDLADPYQMHSTLCRAFSDRNQKCPEGQFLWRLEPETDPEGHPRVLVQSRSLPDWSRIEIPGWFFKEPDPPIDIEKRLVVNSLQAGRVFRFRLRANPCVTRNGKRLGLLQAEEQEVWIERKGREHCGFSLPCSSSFDLSEQQGHHCDVSISQARRLQGMQRSGNSVTVYSVMYDGILTINDPIKFRHALENGVGHGKALGLGLLSVVPLS